MVPDKTICRVGFYLAKAGSPTGSAYARIRRVVDDTIIETSPIVLDVATIGTSWDWYLFAFNSHVNEEVRFLFEFAGGDASNYISVGYQSTDVLDGNTTYFWRAYIENLVVDATIQIYEVPSLPPTHALNVGSTPVSVPVTIDDSVVGNAPVFLTVSEGQHSVSVPAEVQT